MDDIFKSNTSPEEERKLDLLEHLSQSIKRDSSGDHRWFKVGATYKTRMQTAIGEHPRYLTIQADEKANLFVLWCENSDGELHQESSPVAAHHVKRGEHLAKKWRMEI